MKIKRLYKIIVLESNARLKECRKNFSIFGSRHKQVDFTELKEYFPNGSFFHIKNIEGWHGKFEGKYIIVFRGADSLLDYLRMILFSKKKVPYANTNKNIKIHYGLLRNYKLVRNYIQAIVSKNLDEEFVIMGQSMGGAIATLCTLDLSYKFRHLKIDSFIFGSPRVGNSAFVKSVQKWIPQMRRFTYGSDLIPELPTKWMGFRHILNFTHLGPKPKKWKTRKDHNWELYMKAIEEEM